jgi:lipid-A-disaccharide synthase-like uncharacterized protein
MPGVPLDGTLLQSHDYYHFLEDAVHVLCKDAGLFPCVVDAILWRKGQG